MRDGQSAQSAACGERGNGFRSRIGVADIGGEIKRCRAELNGRGRAAGDFAGIVVVGVPEIARAGGKPDCLVCFDVEDPGLHADIETGIIQGICFSDRKHKPIL